MTPRAAGCDALQVAPSSPRRRALTRSAVVLGVAALASTAVTASASRPRVAFVNTSQRVVQGSEITATVAAPSGALCSLTVRYYGGSKQKGLKATRAVGGRASWTWRVALHTRAGTGRMTASCGGGRATRSLVVVGQLIAPRISVVKDGFSVRVKPYGGGSVSYGVILKNQSPNADALNVYVLVNLVMPNNKLAGSQSSQISVIRAGATYGLGANLGFPGAPPPIARLEVVVQVGGRQPAATHMPSVGNIEIFPSSFDPGWTGGVEGELINTDAKKILQNASLSSVIFDGAGNVIGGGSGGTFASLPPGTRVLFKLESGFDAIPYEKAASALVSVVPSWQFPPTPPK
jgi:hypothetical protein